MSSKDTQYSVPIAFFIWYFVLIDLDPVVYVHKPQQVLRSGKAQAIFALRNVSLL